MFISNDEKSKLWDNISDLLKRLNAINADIIYMTGKIKGLEAKVVALEPKKPKPPKQKTAEQIQKQKEKQRDYNRRYIARKKFERLERDLAKQAERNSYATSISTASV